MNKYNACISIISSRNKCIKPCLESLWKNYNSKYDYPVYVYYFDDIYDSQKFRKDIADSCPQKVTFCSIPYKTPDFLKEDELFYNRKTKTILPKLKLEVGEVKVVSENDLSGPKDLNNKGENKWEQI